MRRKVTHEQAAGGILALLEGLPAVRIGGIEEMPEIEKLFMLSTCCACLIEDTLLKIAGGDSEKALRGLEALVESMRDHLKENSDATVTH